MDFSLINKGENFNLEPQHRARSPAIIQDNGFDMDTIAA